MKTSCDRAAYVGKMLNELYPDPPIPLNHSSAYTLLIAVLLSAQCTDKRVNLTTPALFAKADTSAKMVQLTVAEIDAIVRPCGLAPRKAQAIHRLSESCPNAGSSAPRPPSTCSGPPPTIGHISIRTGAARRASSRSACSSSTAARPERAA